MTQTREEYVSWRARGRSALVVFMNKVDMVDGP